MLVRSRVPGFATRMFRSKAGLWFPGLDTVVPKHRNVLAVLDGPEGRRVIPASNIVTDDGDVFYAQRGAGAVPTDAFGIQELQSAGTPAKAANRNAYTHITASQKAHTATYPKVSDADADNTGSGVDIVTWLVSYTKTDFTAAVISHGIVTNVGPGANERILTGYAFGAPFAKTSDDTLKVFVNHEMLGV